MAAVDVMAGVPVELLVPNRAISYVPSGTFLARLRDNAAPTGSALLALGDPVFKRPDRQSNAPPPLPPGGLLITMVAPDGIASAARLQAGDVLLTYGGEDLTSVEKLPELIAAQLQTTAIPITIWRNGFEVKRTVSPGELGVVLDKDPASQAIANHRRNKAMLLALRGGDWQDLPGTRMEVTQLAMLYGEHSRTLLDSAASEQSLDELRKSGDLSKLTYLHFATHGAANNVRAMESVLILAQDKLPEASLPRVGEPFIDGRLSARGTGVLEPERGIGDALRL